MDEPTPPGFVDKGPMIRFAEGGQAPVLSYDVPQPSEYTGRYFLELLVDDEAWKDEAFARPVKDEPSGGQTSGSSGGGTGGGSGGGTRPLPGPRPKPHEGLFSPSLHPDLGTAQGLLDRVIAQIPKDVQIPPLGPTVDLPSPGTTVPGLDQLLDIAGLAIDRLPADVLRPQTIRRLDRLVEQVGPAQLVTQVRAGARLVERRTLDNRVVYALAGPPDPAMRKPRLAIVHVCRLSSYLGEYGAGRTISTFSLLPGEQHQIEIKTYRRSKQTTTEASSILDSFEESSADEFQNDLTSENSAKDTEQENFNYQAQAEASATWGWGSAHASGGVSGSSASAREEFAKNVASTTQKHSATAAAKRQVEINTTSQSETEEGEERAVKRTIQNINVGRTLNFVFRQMNQVFVSALSVVDVRIAFRNGDPAADREFTLPELDTVLDRLLTPSGKATVKAAIWRELSASFDWNSDPASLIEGVRITGTDPGETPKHEIVGDPGKASYWRYRRQVSALDPLRDGANVTVPGAVIGVTRSTLPTDGVVVDALLGQGNALDAYSMGLQMAAVEEKDLANERVKAETDVIALKLEAVKAGDKQKVGLLAELFGPPERATDG